MSVRQAKILGGIMAKHTTQKTGPAGRAKTLAIRKARAAKLGAIRTTRAGRIAR